MVQPVDLWVRVPFGAKRKDGVTANRIPFDYEKASDAEVVARLRQVEGVEEVMRCSAHGCDYDDGAPGCGTWMQARLAGVLIEPCVVDQFTCYLVVPVPDSRKETQMSDEGWAFPGQARKAHWMLGDGRSLCGGWGFYRGPVEHGNDDSPDNCAQCKKRLPRHRAAFLAEDPVPDSRKEK